MPAAESFMVMDFKLLCTTYTYGDVIIQTRRNMTMRSLHVLSSVGSMDSSCHVICKWICDDGGLYRWIYLTSGRI